MFVFHFSLPLFGCNNELVWLPASVVMCLCCVDQVMHYGNVDLAGLLCRELYRIDMHPCPIMYAFIMLTMVLVGIIAFFIWPNLMFISLHFLLPYDV